MLTTTTNSQVRDELVAIAREMRPRLIERAATAEQERRLPDETLEEMREAGFFNYLTPARFGGAGGGVVGQIDVAAELAKGCPSTAWVFTLIGDITAFAIAYLPQAGADAILASSDRPLVCGVAAPNGTAVPVPGGYRLNGSWGFASGCLHANWAGGGAFVLDDRGTVVDQIFAFVPMQQLAIKDTWHVAGMRATGSNTLVAQDVFVPNALAASMSARAAREAEFHPGDEPVDRMPNAALFSIGLMGPTLGMADELLEQVTFNAHSRGISFFDFDKQVDSAVVLEGIGQAAMQIDTAWLHVRRGALELEETTKHHVLDRTTRARCRADAGHACVNLRSAVDSLMSISGASAFAESNRLQRFWRDINVASRHAFVNSRPLYETYGREYAGVETNITSFI
ncbi:acyl-CoA dehydrogenase family protein [Mycolicibacterium sp. CBM1]